MTKKTLYLLCPIFWPVWLGLGILWLIIQLPFRWRYRVGKSLGRLLYFFPNQMKHITEVNLELSFPELTAKERQRLAKANFASLGVALVESAMAWWLPDHKLQALYELKGYEHVTQALAKGKGVILLAPHFTCLEMVGRLIGMHYTFGVMYRPHKKPFISYIHAKFRKKHYTQYIPSNRVRELLKALRKNIPIWYAYDIDGGIKRSSVFAPFFNVPTSTLTSVSRLARLSGAAVIPMEYYRREDTLTYEITLSPPLKDFPTAELVADATRLNAILEASIRKHPDQYVWQYKRFKTRPSGERRFYYSTNPNR
jgi:Kdo2-lipid IVA lauroyltransferase/acyltransferase